MSFEGFQRRMIVREARSWVRTPYHQQGDIKGIGVDCGMLLVRVFVDTGLCAPFDPRPYANDWYLHRGEERYLGFHLRSRQGSARTAPWRCDGLPLRPLLLARGHRDDTSPLTIVHAFQPALIVLEEEVARSPALSARARHPKFFSLWAKEAPNGIPETKFQPRGCLGIFWCPDSIVEQCCSDHNPLWDQ